MCFFPQARQILEREYNNLLALGTDRRLDEVSSNYHSHHCEVKCRHKQSFHTYNVSIVIRGFGLTQCVGTDSSFTVNQDSEAALKHKQFIQMSPTELR